MAANPDNTLAVWIAVVGGSAGLVTAIGGILQVLQNRVVRRSEADKNSADAQVGLLSVADVHLYRPAMTELARVRASQAATETEMIQMRDEMREMRSMMRIHSNWDDKVLGILRAHDLLDENVPAPPPLG